MKKGVHRHGLRLQTVQRERDAREMQPWRCSVCGVAVRRGFNDPCKCVTPDKPSNGEPAFTSPEWEGEALLSDMLTGNAHDEAVCEWLHGAKVGDVFDEYHGARVTRVR